jgi:hypothetical protein
MITSMPEKKYNIDTSGYQSRAERIESSVNAEELETDTALDANSTQPAASDNAPANVNEERPERGTDDE